MNFKTDANNSHGKVFVVNDDIVEVWDEIKEVLMISKPFFSRDTEKVSRMTKITNEMVEIAYNYAKKVYSNELTRNEGKIEVAKVSGMNVPSGVKS